MQRRLITTSASETYELGRRMGGNLEPGDILALFGELGSGKTCFTQGLCAGLGIPRKRVISPTYAFVHEYEGRLPVLHLDLYRIDNLEDALDLDVMEYLSRGEGGIVVIEWADRIMPLLDEDTIQVIFNVVTSRKREILVSGREGALDRLVPGEHARG